MDQLTLAFTIFETIKARPSYGRINIKHLEQAMSVLKDDCSASDMEDTAALLVDCIDSSIGTHPSKERIREVILSLIYVDKSRPPMFVPVVPPVAQPSASPSPFGCSTGAAVAQPPAPVAKPSPFNFSTGASVAQSPALFAKNGFTYGVYLQALTGNDL